jgi:AcrR family transcriptional regulator
MKKMEETKISKSELKLKAILKAAKDCFARYGYEKTTLDDIGKIARLNKASLYYYFKNKEDIFIQVVLSEAKDFIEKLQNSALQAESIEEKIVTYLIARMRYYRDVLNLHQLSVTIVQEIQPKFDEVYQGVKNEEIAYLESILKQGIKQKVFELHNSLQIAEVLITIADALKHEATFRSNTFDMASVDYSEAEKKIEMITKLILKGLNS